MNKLFVRLLFEVGELITILSAFETFIIFELIVEFEYEDK
jgi:hypothetical protein